VTGLLLDVWVDWVCPNGCGATGRTRPLPPNASQFHTCPRLHMLTAPLVRAGSDCKVVAVPWEDYQGTTLTQDGDDGRPYSAVHTIRADGSNDAAVLAPCATSDGGA
jgi:hypothetical protein